MHLSEEQTRLCDGISMKSKSIKSIFPIQSCDQAVNDAILWKLATAQHIHY